MPVVEGKVCQTERVRLTGRLQVEIRGPGLQYNSSLGQGQSLCFGCQVRVVEGGYISSQTLGCRHEKHAWYQVENCKGDEEVAGGAATKQTAQTRSGSTPALGVDCACRSQVSCADSIIDSTCFFASVSALRNTFFAP